ncbi:MAG: glutamate ABC transporter substrate-binding protein [Alcaligenaceae bacterium]|nr:MAG: glutamate ABC transporter substrate-binding protein [Alcaligenaceae bacterium]
MPPVPIPRDASQSPLFQPLASAPEFPPGSTMAQIQQRGKIVVGVKYDQPLFGLLENGRLTGFEIEIARMVAQSLGLDPNRDVEFLEAVSKNRETFLTSGKVDMVVGTYIVTPQRLRLVDFAGPYYSAGTGILVRSETANVRNPGELNGHRVCYVTGADSLRALEINAPHALISGLDGNSQCADAVANGQFDAGAMGRPIALGISNRFGGNLKIVDPPMTDEQYGIGIQKGRPEWKAFLDNVLRERMANGDLAAAYERTVGSTDPEPPTFPEVGHFGAKEPS